MQFKRIVIKVGSALIAPEGTSCKVSSVLPIAQFIQQWQQAGVEVVLVSSGAVAAGRVHVAHGSRNVSITTKQAMASVGQSLLMSHWQRFFDNACAQLLITHDDLKDRARYLNIKNTLRTLLANDILPIVNENDTVATQELKVGDNDNLAALVAMVCDADALVILSDVDGIFDSDPRSNQQAKLVNNIPKITEAIYVMAGGTSNAIATGGMRTKIEAAEKATLHGIDTFIINGSKSEHFSRMLEGSCPGSHFKAQKPLLKAKKHWLQQTLPSTGRIVIDQGARDALRDNGASLLATGIIAVEGYFVKGDAVNVVAQPDNQLVAKGIVQYSQQELQKIIGKKSQQFVEVLGYCPATEVIHRDDMVIQPVLPEEDI
ncbi:glutamate 5-kinase [Thalassotalea maritima]|uniref:glutamate 5-kinase n=1 Tax=Thalassotalea maritima TaxID=3242416 RepID=UPI003528E09D